MHVKLNDKSVAVGRKKNEGRKCLQLYASVLILSIFRSRNVFVFFT